MRRVKGLKDIRTYSTLARQGRLASVARSGKLHDTSREPPWQFIKETTLPNWRKEMFISSMKFMMKTLKFPEEKAKRWVEADIQVARNLPEALM